ncbi:MAG TPA: VOC family protein [candidate division Zixibacteria bacterium]|nr:VOC family protein [candidate division Zixibacteria bacterium]
MEVQPYLFFDGCCEEAIEFYQRAVGAETLMLMRFKDSPEPPPGILPAGSENKIMHAALRIGDTIVMASDGHCSGKPSFRGFSLSLSVPDVGAAERVFVALSEGGQVQMPLGKTFWSPRFGMLTDRFGIGWMVNVTPPEQAEPARK